MQSRTSHVFFAIPIALILCCLSNPPAVAQGYDPEFGASTKEGVDLNGGQLLLGDLIEWTITVINSGWRFTNMSTMLILAGMVMFLIGLLSEQLTNLQFKDTSDERGAEG